MKKTGFYNLLVSFGFISLLLLISTPALAHKVNIFAYAEGDTVYTESYFPDGRRVSDGKVEVYDSKENKLLEGVTDKEGVFNFKTPKQDDLKIVLIASMGHRNSFTLSADELAEAAGVAPAEPTQEVESTEQVEHAPAKPKARPRAPDKEPIPISGILGGLGFIFGLTALILQLTGKKKG